MRRPTELIARSAIAAASDHNRAQLREKIGRHKPQVSDLRPTARRPLMGQTERPWFGANIFGEVNVERPLPKKPGARSVPRAADDEDGTSVAALRR